jgi:hypothetical protein
MATYANDVTVLLADRANISDPKTVSLTAQLIAFAGEFVGYARERYSQTGTLRNRAENQAGKIYLQLITRCGQIVQGQPSG